MSVGVTALTPPIRLSHFADAGIGLGPPTSYPSPLKWWDLLIRDILDFKYFGNPFGRQYLLAEGFLLSSLPFLFLSILVLTLHLIVEFGSSRVRVPHPSPIAFSTSIWLRRMKVWGVMVYSRVP